MGIQRWGALGGFQKKSGPAIGRWQKGQNLIGPLPHPSQKPATEGQLLARNKFGTVVEWQKWISPIIRVGFQNAHSEKETAFNAAFVKNYRNALVVSGSVVSLDYAALEIASGMLSNGYMTVVATTIDAQLDFSWGARISNGIGAATDLLTIVTYSPVRMEFCNLVAATQRSALSYDFPVPSNWSGEQVYIWLFFVSADGKVNSNSQVFGPVEIQ